MSLFQNQNEATLKKVLNDALDAALQRTRKDWLKLHESEAELLKTRREIETLKIEQDRIKEGHERERREIEHKVGLEKIRQEQEIALARREAIVSVQEQNLDSERKRFEEQMRFTQERFEQQFTALKEHLGEITQRLPSVNWDIQTTHNGKAVSSRRG